MLRKKTLDLHLNVTHCSVKCFRKRRLNPKDDRISEVSNSWRPETSPNARRPNISAPVLISVPNEYTMDDVPQISEITAHGSDVNLDIIEEEDDRDEAGREFSGPMTDSDTIMHDNVELYSTPHKERSGPSALHPKTARESDIVMTENTELYDEHNFADKDTRGKCVLSECP